MTKCDKIHGAIGRIKKQVQADERKYKDLLQPSYYHGYIDGQRSMIRLLEKVFSKKFSSE